MAIKVLIRRNVPGSVEPQLATLLKELRVLTTGQKGYISGETFYRCDREGESLVISTWQSADDWREWVISSQRQALQKKIDDLLGQKTVYEIYEYA